MDSLPQRRFTLMPRRGSSSSRRPRCREENDDVQFGTPARSSSMLRPDRGRGSRSPRSARSIGAETAGVPLRELRTISRLPAAAENYQNLRMEGLTRLQEHRLELQHRLDMHRTMEMPPSPSPSSRSLAPFSSASSSLSEGSNQPSGEDSASIVTGTLFSLSLSMPHPVVAPPPLHPLRPSFDGEGIGDICSSMTHKTKTGTSAD